ncbi:MAG: S-layer homology domain-containing protein [Bacillota bacterium]
MKHVMRTGLAFLFLLVIFSGLWPATALAADGELVLTSIRHSVALGPAKISGTSAILTVPYSYSGSVNLSQGLDITYSTTLYTAAIPSFPNGSTAVVGGPAVTMVVTYRKTGNTAFYSTSYTISVVRAEYKASTFSGTITKSASPTRPATFTEADFTDRYTKNDGAPLGSVIITGSNPSFGTLKIGSQVYQPGAPVTLASIKSGSLTFAATGAGTVDYVVEAYGSDAAQTQAGGVALLRVTAVSAPPTFSGTISKTLNLPSTTLTLSAADFTGRYAKNDGGALASIVITGSNASFGKLRLGNADYTAGTSVPIADVNSGKLTFVATSAGTVSYTVKAYAAGDATSPVGTATLKITVAASAAEVISYETKSDTPVDFDVADFNSRCRALTGEYLNYVRFSLPSSAYGKLYYDYESASDYDSTVSSSTKYYRNSAPYLSYVTFVPKAGFSGSVTISYTGYNTDGQSYSGKVSIAVSAVAEDISYTTTGTQPVFFDSSDFNEVCDDATGEPLSYVKFKLPSSSYGKLYYGYDSASNPGSAVTSSTKYYRKSSRYLSEVAFVPKSGYSGTVSISYDGWDTDGNTYSGKVKVVVKKSDGRSAHFDDVVSSYSWASEAIDYLYGKGVVTGTGPKQYNPSAAISRGDFVLMLYRAFELKASWVSDNFTDVPAGSYYHDAIATAKALGIATGDGGRFRPAEAISRQEAMVMIARTLASTGVSIPKGGWGELAVFTDYLDVADYAVSAAGSLVKAKIITGAGGKLNPRGSVTRAEMAVILHRALTMP